MNAVVAEVNKMVSEDRIARIESDVVELKGDVKALIAAFLDFKIEVAKEFGAFRAEVEREFGAFRAEVEKEFGSFKAEVEKEFGSFRAEVAKEFGSVRAEIRGSVESLRTAIERTKVWMLCTGISTVLGVAAIVGFKLH